VQQGFHFKQKGPHLLDHHYVRRKPNPKWIHNSICQVGFYCSGAGRQMVNHFHLENSSQNLTAC